MNAPTTELIHGQERVDQVDPELLDLPAPPKRERSLTVALLLFTALASLAMVASLRRDAAFAFSPARAESVGDLNTAPAESFRDNSFVQGRAMLGAAKAIRYERPLVSASFRLMPVAGRSNVWAEVRVPAGAENARWVPPDEIVGRLVRFEASGPKHRGLAAAVKDVTGQDVAKDAWLLVQDEGPGDARAAVLLVLLFAGFAAWNVFATTRLLRKVR
jgi:hypothetical protein